MVKALKIAANQKGKRYALVPVGGAFSVYAECLNYASHVRGGMAKTWRYCERGLTRDDAEALFAKKIGGAA